MGTIHSLWGKRIQTARQAAGMTQVQLAAAMGVSQQQVSNWEHGLGGPRDTRRPLLARILGTTVADLFPYPDDTNGDEAAA